MQIKGFSHLVQEHLKPVMINNSHTIVIDGSNFLSHMYVASNLKFNFGPECDIFASYIKNYLDMFKKSNVKCFFLIDGGLNNIPYRYNTKNEDKFDKYKLKPLMMDIFLQVLNEMNFEYAITYKKDIVEECVALASKLACPVVSYNIRYCFTGVSYIPLKPGTKFNLDQDNNMKCGVFTRQNFLSDHKITMEELIIFILLTDTKLFDENVFKSIFDKAKTHSRLGTDRYKWLLRWLHLQTEGKALEEILKFKPVSEGINILKIKNKIENQLSDNKNQLSDNKNESMAISYFVDKEKVQVRSSDPQWFVKGIALRYIHISYINLYHSKLTKKVTKNDDSDFIEKKYDNSDLLSIDIIKYAFDLLTNFKDLLKILVQQEVNQEPYSLIIRNHLQKPTCNALHEVFEDGWNNIRPLKLFEHFLIETLQTFNFEALERVPADSRMLMIALVYFTRKKTVDVQSIIYSVILCYVILAVVAEKADITNVENITNFTEKPILDSTTDKVSVTESDCKIAASIMGKGFTISDNKFYVVIDRETLNQLVEFLRCLQELNNLNTLCGKPFNQTVYAKTYNARIIYKVLFAMKESDAKQFITDKLSPAATVLAFINGMVEVYEDILYEY